MLLSIALVPIGIWLYAAIGGRRRRRLVNAFGASALSGGGGRRRSRLARAIPPALVVVGLVVVGVALARPQAVVALPRQEGTVILAFDVSDSMAATDVAPTRMEAAKTAARDFVASQPATIYIGVVAFSDAGVSAQTPTNDQATVLSAIDRLTPQKGTSLAAGINAALDAIAAAQRGPYGNNYYSNASAAPTPTATPVPAGVYAPAVIVLLTDGENNESPDPLAAAQKAANEGVRIYTVGIGSAAGADLDVNGVHVHTQLDAIGLQQISQVTGGTYYSATDAGQLRSVYDNLSLAFVATPELTELTALFAGVSGLLLLAGGMTSLLWWGRLP